MKQSWAGGLYEGQPHSSQGALDSLSKQASRIKLFPELAQVQAVYTESGTCDVIGTGGNIRFNVPVKSKVGLNSDGVFGELELPAQNSWVIVNFLEGREGMPFIEGTISAYMNNLIGVGAVATNSGNKSFTKTLFEKAKTFIFRKIFQSGTTAEVPPDGSVIVETPSGSLIQIDETNHQISINLAVSGSNKVQLIMKSTGEMDITTATGGKVVINGHLEIDA